MIKVRIHKYTNRLSDCEYSKKEQEDLYDTQLQDLLDNTRWYLDNLDKLTPYKLYWYDYDENYSVKPHKYCKKRKAL